MGQTNIFNKEIENESKSSNVPVSFSIICGVDSFHRFANGTRKAKKLFIAQNMNLTESEAKVFWPVYENYQKDLEKLVDKTVKLIENYSANYQTMTEEAAKELINGYLAIEGERVALMKSFLPKFRKVLPEKKVARYYQLENKIDAVVNYGLAKQIPLVK